MHELYSRHMTWPWFLTLIHCPSLIGYLMHLFTYLTPPPLFYRLHHNTVWRISPVLDTTNYCWTDISCTLFLSSQRNMWSVLDRQSHSRLASHQWHITSKVWHMTCEQENNMWHIKRWLQTIRGNLTWVNMIRSGRNNTTLIREYCTRI